MTAEQITDHKLAPHMVTERLPLSPLRASDSDEMFVVLNDSSLHQFIGGAPLTRESLHERYRKLAKGAPADGTEVWLNYILRSIATGVAMGTVQATLKRDAASVAWIVGTQYQRQGFAQEATRALIQILKQLGLTRVTACIHADHVASQCVAAAVGFACTTRIEDGEQVWEMMLAEP